MPIPPSPAPPPAPLVTVMGVSGSGKTTVGAALAQRLRIPFADADDFHPAANVAKMAAGTPLDDLDRLPWLQSIGLWLADHTAEGGVLSASALGPDEAGVTLDLDLSVDELVANAHAAIRRGVDSITVVAGGASWRM